MVDGRSYNMTVSKLDFGQSTETLNLRIELEPTMSDWVEFDGSIANAIRELTGQEIGLGTMHFMRTLPKFDLRINPGALGPDVAPLELFGVTFERRIVIARRCDKTAARTERFFLQLWTKIPRTPDNTAFLRRFFEQPLTCDFTARQQELDYDKKGGGDGK